MSHPDKSSVTTATVLGRILVAFAVTHLFAGPLDELDLLDWTCVAVLSAAAWPGPKEVT